jgi:hypothetical protein
VGVHPDSKRRIILGNALKYNGLRLIGNLDQEKTPKFTVAQIKISKIM